MMCHKRFTQSLFSCVVVSAMLFACATQTGFGQIPQLSAPQYADQAYHELSLNNYAGAIDNFTKALAGDPSNTLWRKDLAYAYLAAGSLQDAASEFMRVYRDNPG